jgi:hypothetical protein
MEPDYLIDRLRALCARFNDDPMMGRFEVAKKATLNEQYLYQILAGKSSKAGKLRSVGMNARGKLTKAFPDWLDSPGGDLQNQKSNSIPLFGTTSGRKLVRDLLAVAERINNEGLYYLLGKAEEVEKVHPLKRHQKGKEAK